MGPDSHPESGDGSLRLEKKSPRPDYNRYLNKGKPLAEIFAVRMPFGDFRRVHLEEIGVLMVVGCWVNSQRDICELT